MMTVFSALLRKLQIHNQNLRNNAAGYSFAKCIFFYVAVIGSANAQTALPAYGYINTVAGNGTEGYSGDQGVATNAKINNALSVAVDAGGNIYIADYSNNRVRKVTASTGIITTVAGTGIAGYNGDNQLATSAELDQPSGVALDGSGNIYIDDALNNRIRKVTISSGMITTVAGTSSGGYNGDNQLATSAELSLNGADGGVALDGFGNIYIADIGNERVRKVTVSSGMITTVAGSGSKGYNGDNQLATSAEMYLPCALALDGYGNIYIADVGNERIREVTISTGMITTVAGTGAAGFSGDGGLAVVAELDSPRGVAVDAIGNIYIADQLNNRIRKVTDGNITTLAGIGSEGYSGDGGAATSATLNSPTGVALDANENVYISDVFNYRIRAVGGQLTASTFNPLYKVVSILYSPPGNQSTEGYGTSTTNGTSTIVGSSFTFANSYSFGTGLPAGIFSVGGSIGSATTMSNSESFTQSFTNATTITNGANSSTTFNPTASNDINHHLDTFEIWLNPLVTFESNGMTPVSYTVAPQPATVNGVQIPFADIVSVPAIAMEATPAGVTALNPSGVAGITTIPVAILVPQAISQDSGTNAYLPGLGAICAKNTLYTQHLAANLAGNPNPMICTQANQCGCTPADFAGVLRTDPLLNYNSSTYTANPYDGTVSPLQVDSLPTSSGAGSGPTTCGLNTVPATANCRYVVVPYPGTNTSETSSESAAPLTANLEGGIDSSAVTYSDSTTTAETLGGSTSNSLSDTVGGGILFDSLRVQDTWTWTDTESVGNSYGTANSMSVTLKSSTTACDETASFYEDTIFHTFAFQVPAGNTACNQPIFSLTAAPNTSTLLSLGHSVSYIVNVTPLYGFTGTVALSASGLPTGVTASFSPASINTSSVSTLTLTAAYSNTTFIGNSTVTVTGTSGSLANSAVLQLTTRPLQYKNSCGVQ
jgi:hypothetical protein